MELRSLQSPAISSVVRRDLTEKLFMRGRAVGLSNFKRYRDAGAGKVSLIGAFRAQASSGTTKFRSEAVESIPKDANSKDENLVFVAGATGKVGSRTVRELLKLGFRVRAGVRSVQRAESLLQSVKQMKLDEATSDGSQPIEKLEIVECDLEKQDQIVPALGNSAIVICCIGASEKEVFDVTGPYRIDYQATKNLVDAAAAVKVNHFILLTSLGTNKVGFPAAILNLFWGVLIWKRKAEEALFASGLPYTIVRPGGMERPTDSYKETHNITLSKEDTLFGGQVSNLQVAELMAFMAKNCSLSYCKVVEVIAETTAPLTPLGELLATIPSNRPEPKVYPSKELGASDVLPTPEASEAVTTSIEEKPTESTSTKTRPLSPYTAYDDLKPPSSPTPNPPSGGKADVLKTLEMKVSISDLKLETVEVPASRPLSPYSAYEDLKPPTSPMPTPSGPRETPPTSHIIEGNDVAAKTQPFTSGHSPFLVYDNLKPPTSPSPGNGTTPSAEQSGEKEACVESKPRPLSPFAMYEDLKPPTSPTPTKP